MINARQNSVDKDLFKFHASKNAIKLLYHKFCDSTIKNNQVNLVSGIFKNMQMQQPLHQ